MAHYGKWLEEFPKECIHFLERRLLTIMIRPWGTQIIQHRRNQVMSFGYLHLGLNEGGWGKAFCFHKQATSFKGIYLRKIEGCTGFVELGKLRQGGVLAISPVSGQVWRIYVKDVNVLRFSGLGWWLNFNLGDFLVQRGRFRTRNPNLLTHGGYFSKEGGVTVSTVS